MAMATALGFPVVTRAAATTQPAQAVDDARSMGQWLSDLASSDATVREAARSNLMRLRRQDLPALQKLIERSRPLAPSQVIPLREIVEEVYLAGEEYEKDGPHGFLGILMDGTPLGMRDFPQQNDAPAVPGVVVADRIPGFCASRLLLDGDVILGTTDPVQVFNSAEDLKYAIGGLEPGTVVHLQVLRRGQIIHVPLTLDSRPVEARDLDSAENFRIRRSEKFNDYWQHTFAPLLKETVG